MCFVDREKVYNFLGRAWSARVTYDGYVQPKQDLCRHPWLIVEFFPGLDSAGMSLVSDPFCVAHRQNLKVQRGGCLV